MTDYSSAMEDAHSHKTTDGYVKDNSIALLVSIKEFAAIILFLFSSPVFGRFVNKRDAILDSGLRCGV